MGIGREEGIYQGIKREWLYWYDEQGNRYLTPEEKIQESQAKAKRLEERLRSLGINPDEV